jgi:hypothetical protein
MSITENLLKWSYASALASATASICNYFSIICSNSFNCISAPASTASTLLSACILTYLKISSIAFTGNVPFQKSGPIAGHQQRTTTAEHHQCLPTAKHHQPVILAAPSAFTSHAASSV